MMLLVMGGKTANKKSVYHWPRKRVIAGNLTQEDADVQFSSVQNVQFHIRDVSRVAGPESKCRKY